MVGALYGLRGTDGCKNIATFVGICVHIGDMFC